MPRKRTNAGAGYSGARRHGFSFGLNEFTANNSHRPRATQVGGAASAHDRNWWRSEARRLGSDWAGILALHAAVVTAWWKRHEPAVS
jgi:hypothetical protein